MTRAIVIVLVVLVLAGWGYALHCGFAAGQREVDALAESGFEAGRCGQSPEICPYYFASWGEQVRLRGHWMRGWQAGDAQRRAAR